MSTSPLSDTVARQYQQWIYPEPIEDLPAWLANNWQWFDPSHAHRIFWPDRDYRYDIDILIAGCGTNQAAIFAYTNPGSKVVAIDVSQASLDHQSYLKDRYALRNLEIHRLPIEEVDSLNQDFDLIVSTGVLHHLEDPVVGMRSLGECLKLDGVAAIMVYARYGRIGVELLQSVFREIGLQQTVRDLFTVKEGIALLPEAHPLRSYLSVAPDLQFDAGLVDTFLHGRDRSYSVDDCLDLVARGDLTFQGWFFKSLYEPESNVVGHFYERIAKLPDQQRWSAMEKINTVNGCHFFMACRSDRATDQYKIDLSGTNGLEAVPHFRYRCGFHGSEVYRPDWRLPLSPHQSSLAKLVDGHISVQEIINRAIDELNDKERDGEQLRADARRLFQMLVNRDFIALELQR